MGKLIPVLVAFVGVFALISGLSLLLAYPTLWLINYLFTPAVLTSLFGVAQLGVWKAWALNMVTGILFKSSTSTSK
jgi:hypothetical protein